MSRSVTVFNHIPVTLDFLLLSLKLTLQVDEIGIISVNFEAKINYGSYYKTNELFIVTIQHNNIFSFSNFNGDMFRSFRPSSGHLTET
jgi:hypothetical protein